jgi:hypothetical protein
MKRLLVAILLALPLSALNLREYQAELDHWSEQVARLEKNPGQAASLRRMLPSSWTIEEAGQRWESPTAWLNDALEKIEADNSAAAIQVAKMQAHLEALRGAADSLEARAPDDRASRGKLNQILARSEYHPHESWFESLKRKVDEWLEKAYRPLRKALDWLFRRLHLPKMPDVSPPFLRILVAALLLGLLYLLSRRYLFRPERAATPVIPEAVMKSRRAWLDFSSRAAQAEQAGDHREAIRLAYWAGIYRLEELGVWRAEITRTHREYLRLIPRDAAQREPLAAITRTFELSWYGGQPASADEFHNVANQLEMMGCQLPSNPAIATS